MEAVQGCIRWWWRRRCVVARRGKEVEKPWMVDGRGGEGSGGEAESMEDERRLWRQRRATTDRLKAHVWPKEEGNHEGGGQITDGYRGRNRKLDDDGDKKMMFKKARDRICGWKEREERCGDQG